ncbi:fimbrial protein [Hafnia alvei]|uniref:fimbrial protein n=1 Tax=Hafnia alvei TaxID=569 RepID=UPI000B6C4690|nr:fimbrial protein [Hafnia alvei]MBI0277969.1 fimbrial protein [Hafnia alvei]PNK96886.1 fimbrial protein [Hafnia alvei]
MTTPFKLSALVAASFIILSGSAMAATTPTSVTGGTVHFKGTVIDAACAVDDNSIEQTVTMGQVRTARFGTAGAVTVGKAADQKVPFSISLKDCDSTVASNASLTFNGTASAAYPSALENAGGPGSASGVGIQIYDAKGAALSLGSASATVALINGENTLSFTADYVATKTTVTSGDVEATATFNVTYS